MPDFIIDAPDTGNDKWSVRVANCTLEHAESVLEHLKHETSVPDNLRLREVEPLSRPKRGFIFWRKRG